MFGIGGGDVFDISMFAQKEHIEKVAVISVPDLCLTGGFFLSVRVETGNVCRLFPNGIPGGAVNDRSCGKKGDLSAAEHQGTLQQKQEEGFFHLAFSKAVIYSPMSQRWRSKETLFHSVFLTAAVPSTASTCLTW